MAKDKKGTASAVQAPSLYLKFEKWAEKRDRKIFLFLVFICIFLSVISFNARISEAHDDALYLEGGSRFVTEFPNYFYTQNAPLYPMFLAVLIKLIGFKLMIFKLFSVVFTVLGFILFYRALRFRVPAIVFFPVAVFHASNHLIMYYASMTFTEAFYFFLQGLFFLYGCRVADISTENGQLRLHWQKWLMFGLSIFLISTAKSAAIVAIPAVILFFILEKNWKAAGLSLGAYLVFKLPYELLVKLIWKAQNQFEGQSRILLQKDPYDKTQGTEDLAGFIQRFIDNCNLSLSKRFYQLLGWRDENSTEVYGLLTILTIAVILYGFWKLFRQGNKSMVLVSLFTGAQVVLSFFILQARWDQPRITLVCMPVLLLLVFYALYAITSRSDLGQMAYLLIMVLMIGSSVLSSLKRGGKNIPVVVKNLKGDKYYGYTPDWRNFLKCSEWSADNLPETAFVASRKAPMSFVYGHGKKFFPVYSVVKRDSLSNQSHPDSALAYFRQNKVTHIMVPSLRLNPNNPGDGIINTIHNIVYPIAQKYPEKLKLVHTEGQFEETYLYELNY